MYPSAGSDAECVPESNAHVTVTLESFMESPISNAVYHVLGEAPCIPRDSGVESTRRTALGLPASAAVHHVSGSGMVMSSVAVKYRCAGRWP